MSLVLSGSGSGLSGGLEDAVECVAEAGLGDQMFERRDEIGFRVDLVKLNSLILYDRVNLGALLRRVHFRHLCCFAK